MKIQSNSLLVRSKQPDKNVPTEKFHISSQHYLENNAFFQAMALQEVFEKRIYSALKLT